jgi:hypothetical protein
LFRNAQKVRHRGVPAAHIHGMTVCSWCDEVISQKPAASAAPAVSHGICTSCLSAELAKLRPLVATPAPFAAQPALG